MKLWEWIVLAIVFLWFESRSQAQASTAPPAANPPNIPPESVSSMAVPVTNFWDTGGSEEVIVTQGAGAPAAPSGGTSGGTSGGGSSGIGSGTGGHGHYIL